MEPPNIKNLSNNPNDSKNPKNSYKTFLRPIKDIILAKSFVATSLIAISVFATSCEDDYEEEIVYTKNVHTIIQEVAPNEFKISDEQIMEGDKSRAYINYLDGTMEEVSLDSLQHRLQHSETYSSQSIYHGNGMGNLNEILVMSAFGSMLLPDYRQRLFPHKEEKTGGGGGGSSYRGSYYTNPSVAQQSSTARTTIANSRVSRPSSSSRGFFGSFRSSGRG
jgi:hypothetical protein